MESVSSGSNQGIHRSLWVFPGSLSGIFVKNFCSLLKKLPNIHSSSYKKALLSQKNSGIFAKNFCSLLKNSLTFIPARLKKRF